MEYLKLKNTLHCNFADITLIFHLSVLHLRKCHFEFLIPPMQTMIVFLYTDFLSMFSYHQFCNLKSGCLEVAMSLSETQNLKFVFFESVTIPSSHFMIISPLPFVVSLSRISISQPLEHLNWLPKFLLIFLLFFLSALFPLWEISSILLSSSFVEFSHVSDKNTLF